MAGNANSGGEAKHPVAPTLRRAFLRGLDIVCDKSGLTLPEIMAELIEQEGLLVVMDRVSKFQERVANVSVAAKHEHRHTHEGVSEADALLSEFVQAGQDSATPETRPH